LAGSSLLALIDDIATVLDDVAVLSKVAAKKTAGVLGDDLAISAFAPALITLLLVIGGLFLFFEGKVKKTIVINLTFILVKRESEKDKKPSNEG